MVQFGNIVFSSEQMGLPNRSHAPKLGVPFLDNPQRALRLHRRFHVDFHPRAHGRRSRKNNPLMTLTLIEAELGQLNRDRRIRGRFPGSLKVAAERPIPREKMKKTSEA